MKNKLKTTQLLILLLVGLLILLVLFFYFLFYKVSQVPLDEVDIQNQIINESKAAESIVFVKENYQAQVKNLISEYLVDNLSYQQLKSELLKLNVPAEYQSFHLDLIFKSLDWTEGDWHGISF